MISSETILTDTHKDEVLVVLNAMSAETGWNQRKAKLREELLRLLSKAGYIGFEGSPYRYAASVVGSSYLYDVPLYKQGLLKKFRGKRVRIVCVGSGRYKRGYMAGVVGKTPKELIVEKIVHNYEFPAYVTDSDTIYKTRRYLVFQPPQSLRFLSEKEPEGFVDLNDWNLILIDGKDGLAKGKLRNNEDGSVSCSLFGWKGRHTGQTLKECVEYLRNSIV